MTADVPFAAGQQPRNVDHAPSVLGNGQAGRHDLRHLRPHFQDLVQDERGRDARLLLGDDPRHPHTGHSQVGAVALQQRQGSRYRKSSCSFISLRRLTLLLVHHGTRRSRWLRCSFPRLHAARGSLQCVLFLLPFFLF